MRLTESQVVPAKNLAKAKDVRARHGHKSLHGMVGAIIFDTAMESAKVAERKRNLTPKAEYDETRAYLACKKVGFGFAKPMEPRRNAKGVWIS